MTPYPDLKSQVSVTRTCTKVRTLQNIKCMQERGTGSSKDIFGENATSRMSLVTQGPAHVVTTLGKFVATLKEAMRPRSLDI